MCEECDGYGKIVKYKCTSCVGSGFMTSIVEENIKIPKGVKTD